MRIWKGAQENFSTGTCKLKPKWDNSKTPTRMAKIKILTVITYNRKESEKEYIYIYV